MSDDLLREALGVIKDRCDRIVAGEFGGLDVAGEMSRLAERALSTPAGQPDSGTRTVVTQDDLIDRALVWFYDTYRDEFPSGGDAEDDANATREGVAAVVVALTQMTPCPYCEWNAPGFQRVNEAGDLQPCGCDRGFLDLPPSAIADGRMGVKFTATPSPAPRSVTGEELF